MTIAEGSAARFVYKFYSVGTMTASAIASRASDPASSGGQVLRRVSASINLRKNATRSQEILTSRQIRSSRHTSKRVEGSITGEFSPGTYYDFIEAAHRDTGASFAAKDETDYTSVTASASGSTLTLAAGDPVSDGLRVGDVIEIANASVAANNRKFLITAFGGTTNRTISVHPAPADMVADTEFDLTRPGLATLIPSTGHVKRKVLIERYNEDLDVARLYEECRITGYRIQVPAEGIATFEAMVMGRAMNTVTAGSAPFFASPSAATTTEVANALNGALFLNGSQVGLVTGININLSLAADAPRVVGQSFPPDILIGLADVSGDMTILLDDSDTARTIFENETEVALVAMLTSGDAGTSAAIGICLPRIKLNSADENVQGEGSQVISCQFQALEYVGSAAGVPATTIRLHDTSAS